LFNLFRGVGENFCGVIAGFLIFVFCFVVVFGFAGFGFLVFVVVFTGVSYCFCVGYDQTGEALKKLRGKPEVEDLASYLAGLKSQIPKKFVSREFVGIVRRMQIRALRNITKDLGQSNLATSALTV